MFEIESGQMPTGAKPDRSTYNFDKMEVGQWFFAPGKKRNTVSSAAGVYRAKEENKAKKFSVVTGTREVQKEGGEPGEKVTVEGVYCKRVA